MIVIAEYVWHDDKLNLRSKSRTLDFDNIDESLLLADEYEEWSYDGSSTNQAHGSNSEIILKPVRVFMDPFRGGYNVLVLCDTYYPNGSSTKLNYRVWANNLFNRKKDENPWFGIEQEFFLMEQYDNKSSKSYTPLNWNENINKQGQYYCSTGANNAYGRSIVDKAYMLALKAGIKCSGMNAEVAPSQWEIQVGPCEGIEAGDHLMMLRYILHRVSELYNIQINFDPKPLLNGGWNGSGCHVNFSTRKMRNEGGDKHIYEAVEKLKEKHEEHMLVYGDGNQLRMTGEQETSSYHEFSYGVANRGSSVRIPRHVEKNKCGYFEDRRPSSNMNPYLVTGKIFETCCL